MPPTLRSLDVPHIGAGIDFAPRVNPEVEICRRWPAEWTYVESSQTPVLLERIRRVLVERAVTIRPGGRRKVATGA